MPYLISPMQPPVEKELIQLSSEMRLVGWLACHKRPYVGVSQGTVLGFGDGFGAILWRTVAKS